MPAVATIEHITGQRLFDRWPVAAAEYYVVSVKSACVRQDAAPPVLRLPEGVVARSAASGALAPLRPSVLPPA